jgi:hypothetical protein
MKLPFAFTCLMRKGEGTFDKDEIESEVDPLLNLLNMNPQHLLYEDVAVSFPYELSR